MKTFGSILTIVILILIVNIDTTIKIMSKYMYELNISIELVNVLFYICSGGLIGFFISSICNNSTTVPITNYESTRASTSVCEKPVRSHNYSRVRRTVRNTKPVSVQSAEWLQRHNEIHNFYMDKNIIGKGSLIRKIRELHDLNQRMFGDIIDVSQSLISQYESNSIPLSYNTITKIIERFNLPTNYFLEE